MAKLCHCKSREFIESPIARSVIEASDRSLVSGNYIDLFKGKKDTFKTIYLCKNIHTFICGPSDYDIKRVWM